MKGAGKASKECAPKFKMKQVLKKTTNTSNEGPANAGFFYFVTFTLAKPLCFPIGKDDKINTY